MVQFFFPDGTPSNTLYFDGVQIGLTATPCVANLEDVSPDEEDKLFVRDTLRFFEVDKPTFSYKLRDAIHDGYLVPYQIYKAKTVKTAADGGFEVKKDELDWTAMDGATRAEFTELFKNTDTITVDPNALERRFTIPERNRAMVREFRQVMDNGYIDAKGVLRKQTVSRKISRLAARVKALQESGKTVAMVSLATAWEFARPWKPSAAGWKMRWSMAAVSARQQQPASPKLT